MMAMQTSQQSPQAEDESHTQQDLDAESPCHQTRAEVEDGEAGKVLAAGTEETLSPPPHSSIGGDSFRDNNASSTLNILRPQFTQQDGDGNHNALSAHGSDKDEDENSGTAMSPVPCRPIPFLPLQPATSEQQEQPATQVRLGKTRVLGSCLRSIFQFTL